MKKKDEPGKKNKPYKKDKPMDIRLEKKNRTNNNYPSTRKKYNKRNIFRWRSNPMGCVAIILIWLKCKEFYRQRKNDSKFELRGEFPTHNGPGSDIDKVILYINRKMPEFAKYYKEHNGKDKIPFESGHRVVRSSGITEDDACVKVYKRLHNMFWSNKGKGNKHLLGKSSEHPEIDRTLRHMVDEVTEYYKKGLRHKITLKIAEKWYTMAKEKRNL